MTRIVKREPVHRVEQSRLQLRKTIGRQASLTGHLAKASNPVRAFLFDVLPSEAAKPITDEIRAALAEGPRIAGATLAPWEHALIGTAVDYRLRYSFAVTPASKFVAAVGVSKLPRYLTNEPDGGIEFFMTCQQFMDDIDSTVTELSPIGRRLDKADEEILSRHCIVLALLEQVGRVGLRAGSPLLNRPFASSTAQLLEVGRVEWMDDIRDMAWLFHDQAAREGLAGRPAILNPTFAGSSDMSGADADLIVDGCLIEIKSTIQASLREPVLHQLLGYTLLDYAGEFGVQSVGIYLARHGVLLRWKLEELLGKSADIRELSTLRNRFRALLRSPLAASGQVARRGDDSP